MYRNMASQYERRLNQFKNEHIEFIMELDYLIPSNTFVDNVAKLLQAYDTEYQDWNEFSRITFQNELWHYWGDAGTGATFANYVDAYLKSVEKGDLMNMKSNKAYAMLCSAVFRKSAERMRKHLLEMQHALEHHSELFCYSFNGYKFTEVGYNNQF